MGNEEEQDQGRRSGGHHHTAKVVTVVLSIVLVVLMLGGAIATCYQRSTLSGQYRDNYEGQVVDKYVTNHESDEGTFVTKHLLIKAKTGEQFQVAVSSAIFARAQVGMWIRRKQTSIDMSPDGRDWK